MTSLKTAGWQQAMWQYGDGVRCCAASSFFLLLHELKYAVYSAAITISDQLETLITAKMITFPIGNSSKNSTADVDRFFMGISPATAATLCRLRVAHLLEPDQGFLLSET